MTEAEWLACDDPRPMLTFLWKKVSARKLRLFACACCRSVWDLLVDERSRSGIERAEWHAEGLIGKPELYSTCRDASAASDELEVECTEGAGVEAEMRENAAEMAWSVTAAWQHVFEAPGIARYCSNGQTDVIALLRDVVGNPFRPASLDPAWRTPTVASLAQATYEERRLPSGELEPAQLAILADALEEAGCADDTILSHLRSAGPHVRGCWALDLILGKE